MEVNKLEPEHLLAEFEIGLYRMGREKTGPGERNTQIFNVKFDKNKETLAGIVQFSFGELRCPWVLSAAEF
jgi:hypothetical protein